MPLFTRSHALIVGVGSYQDSKWNAPVTVADATSVAETLKDVATGAYSPKQVTLLHDAAATRTGLSTALRSLSEQAQADDTVLIFLCGHGALGTDGVYYFATHDAVFENGKVRADTGFSASELMTLLRSIRAQKLLLIINACFSGNVSPTLSASEVRGTPPSATLGVEVLATGEGRALITASRPTQYSYYMPNASHTFFGQALVDGLRGAAAAGGYVGLYELYQHLYSSVKVAAANVNGTQEPMLTILQGVGPFPVALAAGTQPNLGALQQTPPRDAAVEIVPRSIVVAAGQAAQAFNVQDGSVDQSRKLVDFGGAHVGGSITTGDITGRDKISVDIKINSAYAAAANNKQEVLKLIVELQAAVSALQDAPKGKRQDAEDDLRKAKEAGEEGDKGRLLEKLESAQKILVALGTVVPVALKLGGTIGAVLQRAMTLF